MAQSKLTDAQIDRLVTEARTGARVARSYYCQLFSELADAVEQLQRERDALKPVAEAMLRKNEEPGKPLIKWLKDFGCATAFVIAAGSVIFLLLKVWLK